MTNRKDDEHDDKPDRRSEAEKQREASREQAEDRMKSEQKHREEDAARGVGEQLPAKDRPGAHPDHDLPEERPDGEQLPADQRPQPKGAKAKDAKDAPEEPEEEYEAAVTNEGLLARSPKLSDEAVEDSIALNDPTGSKDAYPGDKEEAKKARERKLEAAGRVLGSGASRQPQAAGPR